MVVESDFIIVGAGIAGTSSGYWLSKQYRVTVLEMESQPGYHTTGRSLAMYTEAYGPRTVRALAKASFEFLTHPPDGFSDRPLSTVTGFMFIAREDQRASLRQALREAQSLSPEIHAITPALAIEMVPALRKEYVRAAFLDPNTLSLDVDAIHQGFIRGMKKRGATFFCDVPVRDPVWDGQKWRLDSPRGSFAAPLVINAAGAWADEVAAQFGARTIGLQPKRRTVIAFAPPVEITVADKWPFVFDTDEQFYFKLDAGTVLASPADETPVPAQDVQPEDIDVALTVDRIQNATHLQVHRIIRKWAGLRSFVNDSVPVVGRDADAPGFFWCAGQGGYGIETSWAMGEATAALASGAGLPVRLGDAGIAEADLSPTRKTIA
ncbi:MAG: FAD-binding oxidoreductase [Gammaproteobacteria bacterium]|nr:FAD-binding oxidoreductase [Gammaproteobacteria bacterium]